MTVESGSPLQQTCRTAETDEDAAAKQQCETFIRLCQGNGAEVCMPHPREKSPGSFRDELGGVIERVAPKDQAAPARRGKPHKQDLKDTAELNERLFEQAWKKSGA